MSDIVTYCAIIRLCLDSQKSLYMPKWTKSPGRAFQIMTLFLILKNPDIVFFYWEAINTFHFNSSLSRTLYKSCIWSEVTGLEYFPFIGCKEELYLCICVFVYLYLARISSLQGVHWGTGEVGGGRKPGHSLLTPGSSASTHSIALHFFRFRI